jgi:hypothetical protein
VNVDAKHGRRPMTCISLRINMTPEELQNVLTNLAYVEAKSTSTHSVVTKSFLSALTVAGSAQTAGPAVLKARA